VQRADVLPTDVNVRPLGSGAVVLGALTPRQDGALAEPCGAPKDPTAAFPSLTALRTPILREQASRAIRTSITRGELRPGQLYRIPQVAAQLGVSATPVREALVDLASEGLVELVRNRGFRVAVLDDQALHEIMQLRRLLEVPAAASVADLPEIVNLLELRQLAEDASLSAARGDLVSFIAADRLFHMRLLAGLNNRRLVELVGHLRDLSTLRGLQSVHAVEHLHASGHEHTGILEALEKHDAENVRRLMAAHLDRTTTVWGKQEVQD
jgi:DNA-binding GntR family transcriptional regulator